MPPRVQNRTATPEVKARFERRFKDVMRMEPKKRGEALKKLRTEFGFPKAYQDLIERTLREGKSLDQLRKQMLGDLPGQKSAKGLSQPVDGGNSLYSMVAGKSGKVADHVRVDKASKTPALKVKGLAEISDGAVKLMVEEVESLKGVAGSGVEHYGTGNPDVLRRRVLVAKLMMADKLPDSLKNHANIANDIQVIKALEHTDTYKKGSGGVMGDVHYLLGSFVEEIAHKNSTAAAKASHEIEGGTRRFYEADHLTFSTKVVEMLGDPNLRARTLVDLLLQFRNAEDVNTTFERQYAGAAGVQAVFEVRQLAAKLKLNDKDAMAQREYALTRSVATSLPVASSNSMLEARHLVAGIRRLSWQMVFGEGANQKGFKTNPYEAIHHNFSGETPGLISSFVGETVFGGGKPQTFVRMVDAMNAARDGKGERADALLERVRKSDPDIAKEWDAFRKKNSDKPLGDALEAYLVSRCQAKLDSASAADMNAYNWYNAVNNAGATEFTPEQWRNKVSHLPKDKVDKVLAEAQVLAKEAGRTNPNGKDIDGALRKLIGLSSLDVHHLKTGNVEAVTGKYGEKLTLIARLYTAVVGSMPSAETLSQRLFAAQGAQKQVAEVIALLEANASHTQILEAIVKARTALRAEFEKAPEGFKRMEIWRLDRELEALQAQNLGSSVEAIGEVKTRAQRIEALSSLRNALEGARLSGLDQIRDLKDPASAKSPTIKEAIELVDRLLKQTSEGKRLNTDQYRAAILTVYEAIVKTTENIRVYVEGRVPDVSEGKLIPDPAFMDNFIKEGPLHYARAISQKAMTVGLKQEMSDKRIVNPEGVTALHRMGQVVFDRVLIAENMADLEKLNAGRNDFVWMKRMDEKKMAAVGGIMSAFPGGFSHAAVYAKNSGIVALSNKEIGQKWLEFARNMKGDKLYYDDRNGQIVLMPLKEAIKQGLVKADQVDSLRPGANRNIKYLSWNETTKTWEVAGEHQHTVDPNRETHNIEIYTAATEVRGKGKKAVSFEEIGELGVDARGLAGEKGTVLGMMKVDPALKDRIPPGSQITSGRVAAILEGAGILKAWQEVWDKDPAVGKITDANFLQSKFYTDAVYREKVRLRMENLVHDEVTKYLVDAKGNPTAAGKELLAELRANKDLAACDSWIVRSSFTAEDRPFKSGAGQYDSFPARKTDAQILEGVMGVIGSAWAKEPIENNVSERFNLAHIWPTITVMKSLEAQVSGVMVSRDVDTGHRRTVSYQVVEGFGGGVESGTTEEGRIHPDRQLVNKTLPGRNDSILTEAQRKQLRETAIEIERLFHQKIEPGKGFAVDIEWVIGKDGNLYIVQARTIRL